MARGVWYPEGDAGEAKGKDDREAHGQKQEGQQIKEQNRFDYIKEAKHIIKYRG